MDKYYKNLCETTQVIGYISRIDNCELLEVSDYLLEKFNLKKEDCIGRKCYEVIHHRDSPCLFCNNHKLKLGEYDKWYAYNPVLDIHLSVRDTLIEYPNAGLSRMCISFEITDEVNSIKEIQKNESRDRLISSCAALLLNSPSIEGIEELLKTVCNYFDADYACVIENKDGFLDFTYQYPHKLFPESFNKLPSSVMEKWYKFTTNADYVYIDMINQNLGEDSEEANMLKLSKIFSIIIAPIRRERMKIGHISVGNPRKNLTDVELLKILSSFVINFIEKQRLLNVLEELSYLDMLTGLRNRNYFEKEIQRIKLEPPKTLGVIFCDLNSLKEINDKFGHEYGDDLIKCVAAVLTKGINDSIYRIGGDEFVSIILDKTKKEFDELLKNLQAELSKLDCINISIGNIWRGKNIDIDNQLILADKEMYKAKSNYYVDRKYNRMSDSDYSQKIKQEIEIIKKMYKI